MIYGSVAGVFRSIITAGWANDSDGSVEASTGHFAKVEIPSHAGERAEMRDAVFSEDSEEGAVFDTIEAGWYLVKEDSDGNVTYEKCKGYAEATVLFEGLEHDFAEWSEVEA